MSIFDIKMLGGRVKAERATSSSTWVTLIKLVCGSLKLMSK